MPLTLTTDQQALLDQFEADAGAANDAATANDSNQSQLAALQAQSDQLAQATIDAHEKALKSSQAFIAAVLKPLTPTPAK